jgi:hypothetical protein
MSESIRYESAERVRDFYREQGRKQERERIIKLLEQQCCDCDSDNCKGWFLPDAESLIALIKGETNA